MKVFKVELLKYTHLCPEGKILSVSHDIQYMKSLCEGVICQELTSKMFLSLFYHCSKLLYILM